MLLERKTSSLASNVDADPAALAFIKFACDTLIREKHVTVGELWFSQLHDLPK